MAENAGLGYNLNKYKTLRYAERELEDSLDSMLSFFIWGKPGIGKTDTLKHIAERKGISFMTVHAAQMHELELRGLPYADVDTKEDGKKIKKATWLPFEHILPIPEIHGEKGILVFDDITLGTLEVCKAAQQLFLERRIGSYTLPDGWHCMATGNNPEDAPGYVQKISPPIKGRFKHITVLPPNETGNHEAEEDMFTAWLNKYNIHPMVLSFCKKYPNMISDYSRMKDENGYPTPRTWEFVSRQLNAWEKKGVDIKKEDIGYLTSVFEGAVGMAASRQFVQYTKIWNQVLDMREMLEKGVDEKKVKSKELDVQWASAISGLTMLPGYVVSPTGKTSKEAEKVINNFFDFVNCLPKEIGTYMVMRSLNIETISKHIEKSEAFGRFSKDNYNLYSDMSFRK
ncbi:MAG: hypothetical protein DDT19_01032 [Syntrophomonadaceae bacterium]|nr:hypothetical protein [Bacillota bacterium]